MPKHLITLFFFHYVLFSTTPPLTQTQSTPNPMPAKNQSLLPLNALPHQTPPFTIHVGHIVHHNALETQTQTAPTQTHIASTSSWKEQIGKAYEYIRENSWTYRLHIALLGGLLCVNSLIQHFCSLYESLIDENTWTTLLTNHYTPTDPTDALSHSMVLAECTDRYIGYSPYGALRRAMKDCIKEERALHSFCTMYRFLQWVGIGIIFPECKNLYQQSSELKKFLNQVTHVIASLMVSRYPNRQIS